MSHKKKVKNPMGNPSFCGNCETNTKNHSLQSQGILINFHLHLINNPQRIQKIPFKTNFHLKNLCILSELLNLQLQIDGIQVILLRDVFMDFLSEIFRKIFSFVFV